MKWFVAAFAVPLVALWQWGSAAGPAMFAEPVSPALLAVLLVIAPLGSAYAGARLALLVRPRRLFDRRAGRGVALAVLGLSAGILCVALCGAALILLDRWAPDLALTAVSGALAGILATLPLARTRAGACPRCGYDLTSPASPGQPGFGVCPECGADSIALAAGRV
ncbi:MAG: hypothetical protein WD749_03135 [Phycisphaerales bacterium]